MMDQIVGGTLFFLIIFAIDRFPSWFLTVKSEKHYRTELEMKLSQVHFIPFSHEEESE